MAETRAASSVIGELRLTLLGGCQIARGGAPVAGFVSTKAQALLVYLAVTGRPHSRDALAGLLWGDLPDADAKANLRQALANLRRLVEPYLAVTRESVAFNREAPYWLDVEAFRSAEADAAADLYGGDFLAGFHVREAAAFEEWALAERERFRVAATRQLEAVLAAQTARGRYALAADAARRILALDPWREEAHCQLMLLLARSGQRSAALAQYETCRRVLEKELGVAPSAATTALYQRLRAASAAPKPTLPAPATPLIGRAEEVGEIVARLHNPHCRLLTLVGLGGSGKTRLALAALEQLRDVFLNGVCFVPLANAEAFDQLTFAIAEALHLSGAGADAAGTLLDYLAEKEMLLALDNFEQFAADEAGPRFLVRLLERAPEVKMLVTSRARLNLQSEWLHEIRSLSAEAAVAVFHHYAERIAPHAVLLGDEALPAIQRACDLAGRLPLTIALAASWARTLSCAEIALTLERDLASLATSMRDAPERHRSLQAVFDQSWRLLAPEEQRVLAALSVFRSPFTGDAAHSVAGATPAGLSSLIDKSWVQRASDRRFELHELVRHYASGKLAQPEAVLQRHCDYFADRQAEREPLVRTARLLEAITAMRAEADDIRLMWQTAVRGARAEVLNKTLHSMFWMIDMTGRHAEGVRLFGEALDCLDGHPGSDSVRGRLLARRGALARLLSDYEPAEAWLTEAEALARAAGDVANQAYALRLLGFFPLVRGEAEAGRALLEASLRLYRALNDLPRAADALLSLGIAESRLGHFERAAQLHQEAADILNEVGDEMGLAVAHDNLGDVAYFAGEPARALAHYRAAAEIQRRYDDRRDLALSLNNLASVLIETQQWREALAAAQESADLSRERGSRDGLMNALQALAGAHLGLGETAQAWRHFNEALAIGLRLDAEAEVLALLVLGAKLLEACSWSEQAARLLNSIRRNPAASAFTVQMAETALHELPATIVAQAASEKAWSLTQAAEALQHAAPRA